MSKNVLNRFFVSNLKRTAQMVSPLIKRKAKLIEQQEEINKELESINSKINSLEAHIRETSGGYGVEDLIERVVEEKNGNKFTKWVLKYPDTIIPPVTPESLGNAMRDMDMSKEAGLPFDEVETDGSVHEVENNNNNEFNIN